MARRCHAAIHAWVARRCNRGYTCRRRQCKGIGSKHLNSSRRLVDHYPRVWQRTAHTWRPSCEQQRPHRTRLPNAECRDWRLDKLHRVVNCKSCSHNTAWRVDVHVNRLLHALGLEVKELRHNNGGHVVVNLRPSASTRVALWSHSFWGCEVCCTHSTIQADDTLLK